MRNQIEISVRINCATCEELMNVNVSGLGKFNYEKDVLWSLSPLWSYMDYKIRCPKCTFKYIDEMREHKKRNPETWAGVPG